MTPTPLTAGLGRRFLGRIEIWFFAALVVAAAVVFGWQAWAVDPAQKCEGSGNWWDAKAHTCGHVVYLPDITHRPAGAKLAPYPGLPASAAAGAGGASN